MRFSREDIYTRPDFSGLAQKPKVIWRRGGRRTRGQQLLGAGEQTRAPAAASGAASSAAPRHGSSNAPSYAASCAACASSVVLRCPLCLGPRRPRGCLRLLGCRDVLGSSSRSRRSLFGRRLYSTPRSPASPYPLKNDIR